MMQYKADFINKDGDSLVEDTLINIKNGIVYEHSAKFQLKASRIESIVQTSASSVIIETALGRYEVEDDAGADFIIYNAFI